MTPKDTDHSVSSCEERVSNAAGILRRGGYSIESLRSAAETIVVLESQEFPRDLRLKFAVIKEAITAEESFDKSLARVSPERAEWIIEHIRELATEVERRGAIEEEEA